jgi:predicted dehydrogenase
MWGRRTAEAVRRTSSLRLVTCYSRNPEKRQAFAREFACSAAESLESALGAPGVVGALLITPNSVHAEGTAACAVGGRHVFVEKPIADSLVDGMAMQRSCEAAGVKLMIGHGFRRLGASRRIKALIDDGVLGQIVLAEANFSLPGRLTPDKWRYYRATCPGGPLMQLGVHHADTLQYLLGPVSTVQGSFARLATEAEIDDVGVAILGFASGARGLITSSYVSPKTYSLRLFGTQGVLTATTEMSIWPEAEKMDPSTRLTLQTSEGETAVDFEAHDMLVEELEEFARCMREDVAPETGAAEGLQAVRVILAAIESHETGRSVSL